MPSALDNVMQQAEDAAANFTPNTNNNLVPQGGREVQNYNPAPRPSLDSMADSAGITVDEYLTVKEGGFRLGDQKGYFHEARVRIDMNEVVPITAVRANRGGQTTFIKSYDGAMTSQGQNFAQAEAHLRATFDKVDGPYQTAEIPATLLEPVVDIVPKGQTPTTVGAGVRIGITPSITGAKFFTTFYAELRRLGKQRDVLDVVIKHKYQTNKNNNEWGVVEFALAE